MKTKYFWKEKMIRLKPNQLYSGYGPDTGNNSVL